MDSLTVQAEIAEIDKVNDFVLGKLANFDCDKNILYQIQLAVEEIFVNIASYAYAPQILLQEPTRTSPKRGL